MAASICSTLMGIDAVFSAGVYSDRRSRTRNTRSAVSAFLGKPSPSAWAAGVSA